MSEFAYHLVVKCFEPTALCVFLLLGAALLRQRRVLARLCFGLALALLVVCGNGLVRTQLIRGLESRYASPHPMPQADCILVLGGGIQPRLPPRQTIEVEDAGDRVLYGAHLYRQGKAPLIVCTGGAVSAPRSQAEDMAELLEMIGVPKDAILKENKALNTRQHAVNLRPLFQERGFKRILLVTSAMHMPRSVGVFKRSCPGIQFVPAPTDFWAPYPLQQEPWWYRGLTALLPSGKNLSDFSVAMHEYVGLAYYKLRGWI